MKMNNVNEARKRLFKRWKASRIHRTDGTTK